jgi:hypothetical protein
LLGFTTDEELSVTTGQVTWNPNDGTLDIGLLNAVTLQVGHELMLMCRNSTASTISTGTAVQFAGADIGNSGRLQIAPMVADGTFPGYVFFGVTTQAIDPGEDGYVTVYGKVRGVDTSGYDVGDILWCDPDVPGGFTTTEPEAPNLKLPVAAVISKASNGILMVRWDTGRRLADLHDVEANGTKEDGDVLTWNETAGRWEAAAPTGADTPITETAQVITENYTISTGKNGLSVGPVEVGATYAVTVPAGATWVII